jgi:hypothetical protein
MAEWKKVVVSGSSAELATLSLDTALSTSMGGTGLNQATITSATGGQVLALKANKSGLEFVDDSSQFTSAGISGSLGVNAALIRTLTATGISGSLGVNAAFLRGLDKEAVSGSLGPNAALIRTLDADAISGSLGANAALIRTLTAAGISGSNPFDAASISGSLGPNAAFLRGLDKEAVSGSLGANAAFLRGLDAAAVSGSLGSNAAFLRGLDKEAVSGSLGPNAAFLRGLDKEAVSGSLGANAALIRTLTAAGISGSINASFDNTTLTGTTTVSNLNVQGTASFTKVTNLSVADKFILLNSGSQANQTGDGGVVIQYAGQLNKGALFGYHSGSLAAAESDSNRRWGVVAGFNSTTGTTFTPSAFMANVVIGSNDTLPTGEYAKKGNIFIGNSENEIWIYGSTD